MYMNQGNKKNKIAIIGHTKGIGKAIAKLYKSKNYEVIGLSRSNGYDLITDQEKILDEISFTATDRAGEKIIINEEYISKNLDNLVKDTDLSKFIL